MAEINAIRASVRSALNNYLAADENGKKQIALNLGIDSELYTALNAGEITAILNWLDARELHFGQSAFISLEALLDDAGLAHSRIDLARDLILTDILTATITPIEKGELILSSYAMNLYAKKRGLTLSPMKMDYDTLKSLFFGSGQQGRVVVRVDGNHYIMITGFSTRVENGQTIEEVHYQDPGAGADGHEAVVITKEKFLQIWADETARISGGNTSLSSQVFGYVISPRAPPASQMGHYQVLTAREQLKVRGAFFFLIIFAIVAIVAQAVAAVAAAVTAIVAAIGSLVAAIGSAIGGFLSAIGTTLSTWFTSFSISGFFSGIWQGLTAIGSYIFNAITFAPNWAVGALGIHAGSFLATSVFSGVLGLEFMGAGKLLEFTGVSPKITNFIVSGGKMIAGVGLIVSGAGVLSAAGALSLGVGLVGGETTNFLSMNTNLAPEITNILSLGTTALSVFAGGALHNGGLNWAGGLSLLKTSLPTFAMDIASSGVEYLGNKMGLDARLTGLLNIGVSSFVGGLGLGISDAKVSLLQGIQQGLKSGLSQAVSYGVDLGLQTVGLNREFGNMLLGVLSGFASSAGAGAGANSATNWAKNFLGGIADTAKKFGSMIVQGVQNVISFGADVLKRGYEAVKNTFTGLFSRETQEVLYQAANSGGVGAGAGWVLTGKTENFDAQNNLTSVVETYTNAKGDKVTMVGGVQTGNFTIQRQMANGDLFQEVYEGLGTSEGGGFGFGNITFVEGIRGANVKTQYDKQGLKAISFESDGQSFYSIDSKDKSPIVFDKKGNLLSTSSIQIWDRRSDIKLDLELGSIKLITAPGGEPLNLDNNQKNLLAYYALANGIRNFNPSGSAPESMLSIKSALAADGVGQSQVHLVPLFEGQDPVLDTVADIWVWLEDAKGKYNVLTSRIAQDLTQYYNQLSVQDLKGEQIVLAYSGSANGTLKAIAQNPNLPVDTVVMWGGPILNPPFDFSQNTEIDRVINIWGSEDEIRKWSGGDLSGLIGKRDFNGVETINIKVEGAHHEDIWYDDSKWQGQYSQEAKELNRRVAKFIKNLLIEARDPTELRNALDGLAQENGVYIVKEKDLPQ